MKYFCWYVLEILANIINNIFIYEFHVTVNNQYIADIINPYCFKKNIFLLHYIYSQLVWLSSVIALYVMYVHMMLP